MYFTDKALEEEVINYYLDTNGGNLTAIRDDVDGNEATMPGYIFDKEKNMWIGQKSTNINIDKFTHGQLAHRRLQQD